ncbi:6-phosphofructokinase [Proteiniclasticum sp. QWL-01]|uniref:6-phosphofructokinase n=1 Tax=Proteiniclasticum sp. QWL-01 TaxID=3036945 RepID=UPI0024110050|nr:6-phosphofructokinase [Proteiniclasticum sp. QWL-01]WFF73632.1 6-phosphofructokinase [Proteiniclasticum sp. QWL-01]
MKKIAILTSGGDAPGMNAAIRAVVRTALHNGIEVMGVERGFYGLINGELKPMDRNSVSDIVHKGGTILKTARLETFKDRAVQEKAAQVLRIFGIEGLVVVGGDGSFHGAAKLSELGINTIGIPGTIDNDLAYTDFTLGFDTAVDTVVEAINKLKDTSASHERCSIVEVMGRHCGDIALYAGIAGGAELVVVPEKPYSVNDVVKLILEGRSRDKHHYLIVMAEGVGGAKEMAEEIEEVTGLETRITVLGHIQRGGSPSSADRILAAKFGHRAVELLMEGKTSRVVGIRDNHIIDMDIHEALAMENVFDEKLLTIAQEIS